jgi:NAD(P)-dependent dehydrogenase (short-subunit alcohol dehydrogenase family)
VRLAREGARVVAADLAADRLTQLTEELPDLDLVPVAGDIASEEGVRAVVAGAGGRVDALANVAGIMDAFLPPAEVDDATWGAGVRRQRHRADAPDPRGAAADAAGGRRRDRLPSDGGWSAI